MSARGVLIVGSGTRVRETALPALLCLPERFAVRGIFARSAKRIDVGGVAFEVQPLEALAPAHTAAAELIYLAVAKDAVPQILKRLAELGAAGTDLLIDTPVVRFRNFRHAARLRAFRNAWVAEDCTALPWFDPVRAVFARGDVGALQRIVFHRSAYAYHGVATAKALLGCNRVESGRRTRLGADGARRELAFADGTRAEVLEPRDYARGWVHLVGARGSISDAPEEVRGALALEPIVSAGACSGFRAGGVTVTLDDAERSLMGPTDAGARCTALMDAMKRVGFLRLLRSIDRGEGAYPVDEALDDMIVDYHLERFGRYRANPFTSGRSALSRFLLRTLSRAGG